MEKKIQSPSKKIRKGDRVIAIAGNSKGQIGVVQSRSGDKIVVQGLNVRKKHVKRSQEAPTGRIVEMEMPIHVSNLKICVDDNVGVKLKVSTNEQGDRHFVYGKGTDKIIYRSVKKPK